MAETAADIRARPADNEHKVRTAFLVVLLTLVGAALRLSTITTRSFWLDEAISVDQANRTLQGVVIALARGVHPPLFHLLLHFWMRQFGETELAIRLFSTMWGILAIPLAYWAGRVIYDRRAGLLSATMIAFAPYMVWYSQEARMYSMMLVFGLLSVGFLALAVRNNRARNWIAYGLFTMLGLFTHYFFVFLVLGEAIYFLGFEVFLTEVRLRQAGEPGFRWRHPLRLFKDVPSATPWLIVMAVLASVFVLWLTRSIFLPNPTGQNALISSATGGGLGYGQTPPSLAWRLDDAGMVAVQMILGFHPSLQMYAFVAMWPLMISALLVLIGYLRPVGRMSMLPPCAAGGIVIIMLLGQWQGQVLASRYFIAVAAPAVLLVAALVTRMPRWALSLVVVGGIVLSLGLWADQSLDPKNMMRYDNRQAIATIVNEYQPGDVVVYEPFYLDPLFAYYMPKSIHTYPFPQYGGGGLLRSGKAQLGQDLDRVSGSAQHVWVLFSFQDVATIRGDAYNTINWFLRNGFRARQDISFNQVRLMEFEATPQRGPFGRVPPR